MAGALVDAQETIDRRAGAPLVLIGGQDGTEQLVAALQDLDLDLDLDAGVGSIGLIDADGNSAEFVKVVRSFKYDSVHRRVVVLVDETEAHARVALNAGADGLVLRSQVEVALRPTVLAVAAGQLVVPASLRVSLDKPTLTTREKQILGMVVLGFSNREIATQLFLSESTVKSHLNTSFRRLGVRSRREATALILDEKKGLGTGILGIPQP